MMTEWRFQANESWIDRGVTLRMFKAHPDGSLDVVTNITFTHVRSMEQGPQEPSIPHREAEQFLRAALNCAWDHGLRPDGYLDTRESMKHVDAHLQDMRALVFAKAGATKP